MAAVTSDGDADSATQELYPSPVFRYPLEHSSSTGSGRLLILKPTYKSGWTDPDAIFDCQIKRIHEYKRQLLNALRIVVLKQPATSEP